MEELTKRVTFDPTPQKIKMSHAFLDEDTFEEENESAADGTITPLDPESLRKERDSMAQSENTNSSVSSPAELAASSSSHPITSSVHNTSTATSYTSSLSSSSSSSSSSLSSSEHKHPPSSSPVSTNKSADMSSSSSSLSSSAISPSLSSFPYPFNLSSFLYPACYPSSRFEQSITSHSSASSSSSSFSFSQTQTKPLANPFSFTPTEIEEFNLSKSNYTYRQAVIKPKIARKPIGWNYSFK